MNFKAYLDYTRDEGIQAGVYQENVFTSFRDGEPPTSHAIKGYLEVRLNEDVPRSWEAIAALLGDGYERIGPLREDAFYHIDTPHGSVELFYRSGLPANAKEALVELQRCLRQDADVNPLPESA